MWNFFKPKKPIIEFAITPKDWVFHLANINKGKKFLKSLFSFLRKEKGNIGFLKIESDNLTHVIMDIETYDQFKMVMEENLKFKDDIYMMAQIIDELNNNKE